MVPTNVIIPIRDGITEGGAIIIGIVLIILAILVLAILLVWRYGNKLFKAVEVVKEEASEAKKQVANDHTENFREDVDSKHNVVTDKLDEIHKAMMVGFEIVHNRFDSVNDRMKGQDDRMTGFDRRLNKWEK